MSHADLKTDCVVHVRPQLLDTLGVEGKRGRVDIRVGDGGGGKDELRRRVEEHSCLAKGLRLWMPRVQMLQRGVEFGVLVPTPGRVEFDIAAQNLVEEKLLFKAYRVLNKSRSQTIYLVVRNVQFHCFEYIQQRSHPLYQLRHVVVAVTVASLVVLLKTHSFLIGAQ